MFIHKSLTGPVHPHEQTAVEARSVEHYSYQSMSHLLDYKFLGSME